MEIDKADYPGPPKELDEILLNIYTWMYHYVIVINKKWARYTCSCNFKHLLFIIRIILYDVLRIRGVYWTKYVWIGSGHIF